MFLSAEWMDLLSASLPPIDPGVDIIVDQAVTGGPNGDVRYRLVLRSGKATIDPSAVGDPDLTLRLPYVTAVALATGRTTAHDAFQAGAVKMTGDLRKLQDLAAATAAFGVALTTVRDQTTYL